MSAELKITPPSTAITPHQLAERVGALYAGVVHGDDPLKAATTARGRYLQLDPIGTAYLDDPGEAAHLHTALGKTGEIIDLAAKERRAKHLSWPPHLLGAEIALDSVDVGIRMPVANHTALKADLQKALNTTQSQQERPGTTAEQKTLAAFNILSAKAMMLHLDAKSIAESQARGRYRGGSEAILRASLGGLIGETAQAMEGLHDTYTAIVKQGGTGDHVSGKLVEMMYFEYELLKWYKTEGSLASGYPRFAFLREDKPKLGMVNLRRSFDVVARKTEPQTAPRLVQVKSWLNKHKYDEHIVMWRPEHQGIMKEAAEVVGAFKAVVSNEKSDAEVAVAWQLLNTCFGEI